MEAIFSEAQQSYGKHPKCAKALAALQAAMPAATFMDEIKSCIACVLQVGKREPAAERVVEFIVTYCARDTTLNTNTSEETTADEPNESGGSRDELLDALCLWLLQLASAKDKAIRFRVAQLVGQMMNAMPEEAEVSDELFETVEEAMLVRCRDKCALVRSWALRALFRLQDPSSADDPVTAELLRLMSTDSSKDVRLAAVSTVAPSKPSIKAILLRTRDVSEEVRVHALHALSSKVEMRWLSISQRAALFSRSLTDRQPAVREKCTALLLGWLRKADSDASTLLKALDVVSYEQAAARSVGALLDSEVGAPAVKALAAERSSRTPEAVLCFRLRHERLAAAAGGERADNELPELPEVCTEIAAALEKCDAEAAGGAASPAAIFVARQLLLATPLLDMANEYGRTQLVQLLSSALTSLRTADELLSPIMRALRAACAPEQGRFARLTLELMSEVEDPLDGGASAADSAAAEAAVEREQHRMLAEASLCDLRAEVQMRMAADDTEAVQELEAKVNTLQAELASLAAAAPEEEIAARTQRCLQLAELLLQAPSLPLREHQAAALKEMFLPVMKSPRPELRALAVRCLGMHALGSGTAAAAMLWPVFVKALRHDHTIVQVAALGSVVDLLLMMPPADLLPDVAPPSTPSTVAPLPPLSSNTAAEVTALLLPLLKLPEGPLRTSAALGAARLLHNNRITSSVLSARLLVLYFLPEAASDPGSVDKTLACSDMDATEPLQSLKQILTVYFEQPTTAKHLAHALLPATRSLLGTPVGSPEAAVPLASVLRFCVSLASAAAHTTVNNDGSGAAEPMIADEVAIALCCESLAAPMEREGALLPRALAHVDLPAKPADPSRRAVLLMLLEKLSNTLTDKTSVRQATKLRDRVASTMKEELTDDAETLTSAVLSAHQELRSADSESLTARAAERVREEEEEAARERRATPQKKKKTVRRLAKSKATPGRMAQLEHDAENELVNMA